MVMAMPDPSNTAVDMTTVPAVSASSSSSGHHWYKNRLQEYTQRSGIQLPIYSTINEGEQHAPMFRTTVCVDGMQIQSHTTFPHRKQAEQDAAKLALYYVSLKLKNESVPNIYEDPSHCKSILYEYGVKLNIGRPTYSTTQKKGTPPVFVATVTFDGKNSVGHDAKNKKEAEQNAARNVIDSILENSNTRICMVEFIRAKHRVLVAASKGVKFEHATFKNLTESDVTNIAVAGKEQVTAAEYDPFNSMFGIFKKGKKRSKKKKKGERCKRARSDEQLSISSNPMAKDDVCPPSSSVNLSGEDKGINPCGLMPEFRQSFAG